MRLGTIVVTGASGLLGSNIVTEWAYRGLDVVGLYRQRPVAWGGVRSIPCDLRDQVQTTELLHDIRPSWVVHAAAVTDVDWCEDHPEQTLQTNVEASRHVASCTRELRAGFVYVSTDSVFDGARGRYSEGEAAAPVNKYAWSKLLGEQAVAAELPQCLIVRTNIYGWNRCGWNRQLKVSLAEWMLQRMEQGTAVPGFVDVVFSPILVNDLADCLLAMLTEGLQGIFHVGGSEACSKFEFGLRVARMFELDPSLVRPMRLAAAALHAARPLDTSLNTDKVAQALGRRMPDVTSGLQRFRALRFCRRPTPARVTS